MISGSGSGESPDSRPLPKAPADIWRQPNGKPPITLEGQALLEKLPRVEELSPSNADAQLKEALKVLAKEQRLFAGILEAAEKQGYRFILYDKSDSRVPDYLHAALEPGETLAVTFKDSKSVYVHPEAIFRAANSARVSPSELLVYMLANEGVHMMSNGSYDPLSPTEGLAEVKAMLASEKPTARELTHRDVLNEEILSEFGSILTVERLRAPGFVLQEENLRRGPFADHLYNSKVQLGFMTYVKLFGGQETIRMLDRSSVAELFKRLENYLESEEIEQRLLASLRPYGLAE